jgi:hypothetical protein
MELQLSFKLLLFREGMNLNINKLNGFLFVRDLQLTSCNLFINFRLLGSMEMWKMHQYPESQPDQGG